MNTASRTNQARFLRRWSILWLFAGLVCLCQQWLNLSGWLWNALMLIGVYLFAPEPRGRGWWRLAETLRDIVIVILAFLVGYALSETAHLPFGYALFVPFASFGVILVSLSFILARRLPKDIPTESLIARIKGL